MKSTSTIDQLSLVVAASLKGGTMVAGYNSDQHRQILHAKWHSASDTWKWKGVQWQEGHVAQLEIERDQR